MKGKLKKKVTVCYLISSLVNEGPVNVLLNIVKYIDFNEFEVTVVTLTPEKENSKLDEFKKLPINIIQLAYYKKDNLLVSFFKLKSLCQRIRPDIIHGHCSRPLYLMGFLPKRYKKIYTIHIYPGIQNIAISGKNLGRVIILLDNYFTSRMDLPIACSESISALYLSEKGMKINSISNGVVSPPSNSDDKIELRKKLGLGLDLKYFIFIGRFSNEKRPRLLAEAFKNLDRNDVRLIMLGCGPLWQEIEENKPDNVILLGFKTNVYEYLKASDFYISLSSIEGLANTLLESMSVGLPMLLSKIPSHEEIFDNVVYGTMGYFVNECLNDFEEKVTKVIDMDSEKASDLIRNLFESKYTAEAMSSKYQNFYINLV